jgi:ribosome-associated translation inhibitor RaiA
MKILIHTDHNLHGGETLNEEIEFIVEGILGHLADHITRVEIHLSDQNGHKGGSDKRCVMEARLEKHQPLAVTEEAESVRESIEKAAHKLKRLLDHTISRLSHH